LINNRSQLFKSKLAQEQAQLVKQLSEQRLQRATLQVESVLARFPANNSVFLRAESTDSLPSRSARIF
jgi:hypothetical protein